MSIKMMKYMIDENQLDYEKSDITFMTDIITGLKGRS